MKFVVSPDLRKNKSIKWLLVFFYIQSALFLILNFFLEKDRWGISPIGIGQKVLGDEELFLEKMDLLQIATQVHIELFFYSFLAVLLLLVFFRHTILSKLKSTASLILFVAIILNSLSPFMIFLGLDVFIYVKWISFYLLSGLFFWMSLSNTFYLLSGSSKKR